MDKVICICDTSLHSLQMDVLLLWHLQPFEHFHRYKLSALF